ncbi:hypothetical protein ACU4GI_33320 [Cupriavidus basilensis]
MLAILEFIVLLFVLPWFLFGILLAKVATAVAAIFEPHLLLAGVWLGSLGLYLMPRRIPDDLPFVGLVDAIAQSHVFGLSTPVAMLAGAGVIILAAAVVAYGRLRNGRG